MLEINFLANQQSMQQNIYRTLGIVLLLTVLAVGLFYLLRPQKSPAHLVPTHAIVQVSDHCRHVIPALAQSKPSEVLIKGVLLQPKQSVALVEIADHTVVPVRIGDVITKDRLYIQNIRSSGIETQDCESGDRTQELTFMWRK